MRLLHTADWHLGKRLQQYARIDEQRAAMDELCAIADAEQPDLVLVAGDLFDGFNPPIEATELLYATLKRLSRNGACAVLAIAGNHDSPERIEAPDALARANGIFLAGFPGTEIRPYRTESGVEVTRSAPGFVELKLPRVAAPVCVLLTPYANEYRLRTYLGPDDEGEALRERLSQRWNELANLYCHPECINIAMAHLFVSGRDQVPEPEDTEAERPILQVGGAQMVYPDLFPETIQYVALGHLHRPHAVTGGAMPVWYSGSPLAYSFAETGQQKHVLAVDILPGETPVIRKLPLRGGKPLLRARFTSVDEAEAWLREHTEAWVEITLALPTFPSALDNRRLHEAHSGITHLIPELLSADGTPLAEAQRLVDLSKSTEALFIDYFVHKEKMPPDDGLLAMFREVLGEDEG